MYKFYIQKGLQRGSVAKHEEKPHDTAVSIMYPRLFSNPNILRHYYLVSSLR